MNKIKIITTIVLFFNVVFSSFIVFAESNYPIATVDNKFCYTMSDVTQNCKDGSVITFLDELDQQMINKILSKKNVIDYILKYGKDKRIKQWILNRR